MEYSYIEQDLKDKVTHLKDESKYIIIKRNEVKKNNRRKNKEYLPKTQISTTE